MSNPFDPGYYDEIDLQDAGFKSLGHHIQIARNCVITYPEKIAIGNHVRIDGFTSLIVEGAGWLNIGSFVHISGGCLLSAGAGIHLGDFSGLSQGVRIFSSYDNEPGSHFMSPFVPEEGRCRTCGTVSLGRHVIVGAGSVVLPSVSIGEGSGIGALSLVPESLESWGVYFGAPVVRLKSRSKCLLDAEAQLRAELAE